MSPDRRCRRARTALTLLALLLAVSVPAFAAPAKPAAPPVKLVVIVSVDGLPWSRLHGYAPWFEAGLKRLLTEGQVETECHYAHLNTETGPGHASLGTGAPPRVTGIVANRWVEADATGKLRRLYCTDQPDAGRVPGQPALFYREVEKDGRLYVFARRKTLAAWEGSGEIGNQGTTRIGEGPEGKTLVFDSDDAIALYHFRHGLEPVSLPGSIIPGPANLRIPTLGDRLLEASPASRVVALSGKDRGAIFLAGKDPRHAVYWYDRDSGRYVSSAAYDPESPAGSALRDVIKTFNQQQAGARLVSRFGTLWKPLPASAASAGWPQPEPNLGHYQVPDMGVGFDHDLTGMPRGYFDGIYTSPFQDQALTDLALAVLAHPGLSLGRRGVPDLLGLSYSAHDVVSHNYGSESAEELDTLRRLDRELGRLLAALDSLAAAEPAGSVVLALSADHGFTPLPEVARRTTGQRTGGRLLSSDDLDAPYPNFQERLSRALNEDLCLPADSRTIYAVEGWSVSFNRPFFPARTEEGSCGPAGKTVTLADFDQAFQRVVKKLFSEEIEDVLLISQKDRWPADGAASFARNDFDAQRSGDAFLVPREEVLMHWDAERGSGHGSHREYDTHVPLLFWGGPFAAGEKSAASAPYDLAVTLADVLGLKLPEAVGMSRKP
jgi:hypothetical protein